MKLLVFAHTPPPHHGQSYMVQLMLEGLGGDRRHKPAGGQATLGQERGAQQSSIECYHVNARLSKHLEDIGDLRVGKLVLLFAYCLQAIYYRFRYGVTNFYYVPAPGKRFALYRDWLVMVACRPFFKRIVLHWHAAGMSKWLETVALIRTRAITYQLMKLVDLSIVLSNFNRTDAEKFFARRIAVVGNGIPDPCPDFERRVLPYRRRRCVARTKLLAGGRLSAAEWEEAGGDPHLFRVFFIAHCTREKGLFDTVEAVASANRTLCEAGSPLRVHLTVAGEFVDPDERAEFDRRITQPDLQDSSRLPADTGRAFPGALVEYKGFVSGPAKERVFSQSDCFCFPTYYYAESFGLVVVEAMAFGLPVITSRWRSIPELMMAGDSGLVPPRDPSAVAEAILAKITAPPAEALRHHFLAHFTLEQHLANLTTAILSLDHPASDLSLQAVPRLEQFLGRPTPP